MLLWIAYQSTNIEVEKEVLLMDSTALISTIGGSLGLFLGYSIFSLAMGCLDPIQEKLNVWLCTK